MTLITPFSKLSSKQERKLTVFLIVFTGIFIGIMRYFDGFLTNELAPAGIVSFELTFDVETAKAILSSWNEVAKTAAGMSLGFDFIFPFLYGTLIALLVYKLNQNLWKGTRFYTVGNTISWSLGVAIVCDLIENIGMIQMLLRDVSLFWVEVSTYFALIKFLIILIGIAYILINFGVFLLKKVKK
jgi:hypothetical protein